MDEAKVCRVCCVSSMVFYPILGITIFWGLFWGSGLLFFSLLIALAKTHFNKIENDLKLRMVKKIVQFLIFNCIFGMLYLGYYLYNKESHEYEQNFIFDVGWILLFSVISILLIQINWEFYLLVVIFIGITQNMVQTAN